VVLAEAGVEFPERAVDAGDEQARERVGVPVAGRPRRLNLLASTCAIPG
jgi:hypothetical protein